MWDESIEDLDDTLRFLISKKYAMIIPEFSTAARGVSLSTITIASPGHEIVIEDISRNHPSICNAIPLPKKGKSKGTEGKNDDEGTVVKGVKASIPSVNIRIFYPALEEQITNDDILRAARYEVKDAATSMINRISDITVCRKREAALVRQEIWNILAPKALKNKVFNRKDPTQLPQELLSDIDKQLHQLHRPFIGDHNRDDSDSGISNLKSTAVLIWAEARTPDLEILRG